MVRWKRHAVEVRHAKALIVDVDVGQRQGVVGEESHTLGHELERETQPTAPRSVLEVGSPLAACPGPRSQLGRGNGTRILLVVLVELERSLEAGAPVVAEKRVHRQTLARLHKHVRAVSETCVSKPAEL